MHGHFVLCILEMASVSVLRPINQFMCCDCRAGQAELNELEVGRVHLVLLDGRPRRDGQASLQASGGGLALKGGWCRDGYCSTQYITVYAAAVDSALDLHAADLLQRFVFSLTPLNAAQMTLPDHCLRVQLRCLCRRSMTRLCCCTWYCIW